MRFRNRAPIAALLLVTAGAALGEEPQGAPPAEPGAGPAPTLEPKPLPPLDFLLLDEAPTEKPRDAAFEAAVARRRKLLSVHQAAGVASWALMGTTVVVGQLNYRDLYGGGGFTEKYRNPHRALAGATAATFAFTGILALSAPEPYAKKMRLDTAAVHKVSMAVTTLGLVSQIALGIWARSAPTAADQRDLIRAHQVLGYATFGAMTIGAVTLVF